MSSSSTIHNVVVVGGGCAGSITAAKLESSLPTNYRVVLIEKRDFFYHTIGAVRAHVEDVDIMLTHNNLFKKNGLLVQAEVVSITEQTVKIAPAHSELGDTIPFSYLVIATGSVWCSPFLNVCNNSNEAKDILIASRTNMANATSVLIVGGGPCGIELAGEIKGHYPNKKVMLIHAQPALLNDRYPIKYRNALRQGAEKRGIELILGDKVDVAPEAAGEVNPRSYTTQSGKEVTADLVIHTIGARPNVGLMNTFDPLLTTSLGIKVKNTLQLDHPTITNIFVAGDAAGLNDCKGAYKAIHMHAPVVASNIVALIKGKGKLNTYTPPAKENTLIVTLGKRGGSSLLGGMVFGDFTTRTIKSKGLFIGSRKGDLGY